MARFLTPPLTTVQVPIAELGRRALEGLFAIVDQGGRAPPVTHHVIAPALAIRASAATAGPSTTSRSQRRTRR